jgi:hypothetical protein
LVGEEEHGPQFFTPERVQAAVEYQANKEDEEEAAKQAKIDSRARKALEKEEKQVRMQLAREERLRKRVEAQSEKLEKAAKRKAQLDEKRTSLALDKARKKASRALNKARSLQTSKRKLAESSLGEGSVPVAKRAIATNSRGRPVITPARYT